MNLKFLTLIFIIILLLNIIFNLLYLKYLYHYFSTIKASLLYNLSFYLILCSVISYCKSSILLPYFSAIYLIISSVYTFFYTILLYKNLY